MKAIILALAAVILAGCATKHQDNQLPNSPSVAGMEGTGLKMIYSAPYSQVWNVAVDVATEFGFSIHTINTSIGFIEARSAAGKQTVFLGMWVRETGEEATELEVLLQQSNSKNTSISPRSILSQVGSRISTSAANH